MENEVKNDNSNDELLKKVNDLEMRVQFIENKMRRDKMFKRVMLIIYAVISIGIVVFAYFYYKNVYSDIIGML